jgi:hypothetical protein
MPWQVALADQALECDERGHLVYGEVRVTVPRQSGKSTILLAKNVQRMVDAAGLGGRQQLVYTAQTRLKAKHKLLDIWAEDLTAARRFAGRWKLRRTIGEESIRWHDGSIWGIDSTTETAGHGDTLDGGDVDEAWAQVDDRVEQAMEPAMMTRPWAQLWIVSTAGTERSVYLRGKVDSGRKMAEAGQDSGVLYIEYSADPDADPEDPETWWSCMPALGYTVNESTVRRALKKALADTEESGGGMAKFCRSYLNLWVPSGYTRQVIPAADWAAVTDKNSEIVGDEVIWCADVAPDSAAAAIAVAGRRGDGLAHVEVVDHREGDRWVVARLVELRGRWGPRPIVIDPAGPVGSLLPDLRTAGFEVQSKDAPDGLLHLMSGRDMAQACGAIKSGAASKDGAVRTWRHIGQPTLDDAIKGAAKRRLLDAWAWTRGSSSSDICPLVAATGALWGLSTIQVAEEPLAAWR